MTHADEHLSVQEIYDRITERPSLSLRTTRRLPSHSCLPTQRRRHAHRGMIGLGGAEFRLPLLIGIFGFVALQAVILNKALSLVVVLTALPARLLGVPYASVADHWTVIVNLLAGSLIGAWLGATWATRMQTKTLYRVTAVLLVGIAAALVGPTWAMYAEAASPAPGRSSPG
ncbi:MAG: sulfite exporter TauE/SafE family protein [Nocardioides sp.]|nr:sulfite exporter TauE/SafE family protein [Nocardioides sp.]